MPFVNIRIVKEVIAADPKGKKAQISKAVTESIIAATALLQQAEVITRNTADFKKVAGLSVIDTQGF